MPAPQPQPAPTAAAIAPDAAPIELVADSRRALPHVPVAWHQHEGDEVFAVAGGARVVISATGVEWAPALFGSGDVHAARCAEDRWLFVINGVTVVVTDGFLGDPVATRELPREGDWIGGVVPDGVVVTAANWRAPMVISCDGELVRDLAPSAHGWVQAVALDGERGLAIVDGTELRRTESAGRSWTDSSSEAQFLDLRARGGTLEARRGDSWFTVELDGALGEAAPDLAEEREAIGEALARDLRVRSPWLWELHLGHVHGRTRVLPNGDRVLVLESPLRVFLFSGSSVRQLALPERERSSGASMKVFDWGEATGLLENDRVLHRLAPDGTVSLLAEGLRRQLDFVGHADSVWVTRGSCDGGRPSDVACWHGPGGAERTLGVDDQSITAEYADAESVLVRVRGAEDDPDELRWLSTNGSGGGEPLVEPFGGRPIHRAADGTRWTTSMEREPELWVRWPGGDTAGEVLSLPPGTRVVGVSSSEWVVAAGPSGVHVHAHSGNGWARVSEVAFDRSGTFSMECTQLGCWLPDGRWVGRVPETLASPIPGIDRARPPHEVARTRTMHCDSAGEPRARQPVLERAATSGLTRAWSEPDADGTRFAWQVGDGPVHRSNRADVDADEIVELRVHGADENRALFSYCREVPVCDSRQTLLVRDSAAPVPLSFPAGTQIRETLEGRDGSSFVLLGGENAFVWARVVASGSITEQHTIPAQHGVWIGLARHRDRVALTIGREERESVLVRELEGDDRRVVRYDTEGLQPCRRSPGTDRLRDVSGRITLPMAESEDRVFDLFGVDDGRACLLGGDGYYGGRAGTLPFVFGANGGVALTWATNRALADYRCTVR